MEAILKQLLEGQKGIEENIQLLQPQERIQLVPLFRKLEELTKDDETAILQDPELLQLIEILKDKLDENTSK